MRRRITFAALIAFSIILSGCLGIEEKIVMHKDGSGVFSYTVDVTEMVEQIAQLAESFGSAFKNDSTGTDEKPAKTRDFRKEAMEDVGKDFTFNKDGRVAAVKGISNFREYVDTANGKLLFGISFGFTDVKALNTALKTMFTKEEGSKTKTSDLPPAIYTFKEGVLTRELPEERVKSLAGSNKSEKEMEKALKDLEDNPMVKEMLKSFKYVIVVEADEAVKSVEAPGAIVEKDGKRVVMDYKLLEKSKEIAKGKMKSSVKLY